MSVCMLSTGSRVAAELGAQAGEPVLQVAPGRRRAQGSGWPLPAARRVNRCCRWPMPVAVRVIRWGGGPRAGVGTWCPGSPMSSVPKVATAGGPAGEPVLQVAPGPPTSPGPRVATGGWSGAAGCPRAVSGIRRPGSSTSSGPRVGAGKGIRCCVRQGVSGGQPATAGWYVLQEGPVPPGCRDLEHPSLWVVPADGVRIQGLGLGCWVALLPLEACVRSCLSRSFVRSSIPLAGVGGSSGKNEGK